MAQLTTRQRAWIRDEVGSSVLDTEIDERFESIGTVRGTTVSLLRLKITRWIENPATVALSGVASVSFKDNIAAVERRIAQLLKLGPDPSDESGPDDEAEAGGPHVLERFDIVRSRRR
jgi:hypothetical protein